VAVGEFYDRFNTEVYKYLWLWCGNEPMAQELAREVWDRALRLIGGVRATADSPLCWLLGLARDRAVEHFHSRRYRLGLIDVATVRGTAEQGSELLAAVRRLSPQQQEAIALTYFCGLDDADAAAVMGRTPAMIQALTWRGRVKLATLLTGGAS
jgi:RNA polymerase sigma-70 factor (ECF subfamily)